MRSLALLVYLAACGTSGPDVTVTTRFDVNVLHGNGPSPLDALVGQAIDVEITLDSVKSFHEDPGPCKSTTVGPYPTPAGRIARGATAATVMTEILDRLPDWDVRFELCTGSQPTIVAEAVINAINLSFGCGGVPSDAFTHDAGGYPQLTSFTATMCNAVILDVVNNRDIGNANFEMTFETGRDHVP